MTSTAPRPALSIVIPCYNEESRLPPSLERILDYLAQRELEAQIVVVDDGSADRTAQVAADYRGRGVEVLSYRPNVGKGHAVKTGVLATRGERVLLTDADLSTPIEDVEKLEARLADSEVVIGSRSVAGSNVTERQPLYRELMGKTFNKILKLLAIRGITDTQCGFKLLRGEVARELFGEMVSPGFAFDVELLWLARRSGYRISEVGVTWVNSPDTRVSAWRDPPKMLLEVLRFRWAHRGRPRRSS